ncbi:MAG: lamin tail domain-containing protein [Candidatus Omnitrophica bacterium]|nr:lamin tail domain-containing protein [Candidatus Omnitrophota bacterium]
MRSKTFQTIFLLTVFLLTTTQAHAVILLTEILADPATDLAGDANADGTTSFSQDEFVELFNNSNQIVDLAGWSIADAVKTRHIFEADTSLNPFAVVVVFGGGAPELNDVQWQTASTGSLGLNNSKDTVSLFNANDMLIDQLVYGAEAGKNQSLVRFPEDEIDAIWQQHLLVEDANGQPFSPGQLLSSPEFEVVKQEESPDAVVQNAVVPELATILYLGFGLPFMRRKG